MPETTAAASAPSLPRTGITAFDADASIFIPTLVGGRNSIRLGAVCTSATPGASIWLSLFFLDSNEQVVTVARLEYIAPAAPDWGTSYVGTPIGIDPCWPLGGADFVVVKVDSLSNGSTWSIDYVTG
jgi:hypothetical protein